MGTIDLWLDKQVGWDGVAETDGPIVQDGLLRSCGQVELINETGCTGIPGHYRPGCPRLYWWPTNAGANLNAHHRTYGGSHREDSGGSAGKNAGHGAFRCFHSHLDSRHGVNVDTPTRGYSYPHSDANA